MKHLHDPKVIRHVVATMPEGWHKPSKLEVVKVDHTWSALSLAQMNACLEDQLGERPVDFRLVCQAISVRQPFAWAILNGKDIENRSRRIARPGWYYLHAGLEDFEPYTDALRRVSAILKQQGKSGEIPLHYEQGGIVGIFQITGWTLHSDSPWFVGPQGAEIGNVLPLGFIECRGGRGVFIPEYK